MDYLQYIVNKYVNEYIDFMSFKPYYKWITFNTSAEACDTTDIIAF